MSLYQLSEPGEESSNNVSSEPILGIDLGTTNSIIATIKDGLVTPIVDPSTNKILIPSVVKYLANGSTLVGDAAISDSTNGIVFKSIKRVMGKSASDSSYQYFPHIQSEESLKFDVFGHQISPPQIAAEILLYLKNLAEKELGHDIKKTVITVPAYFDENARKATKDAARIAGLEVVRLLNEPTAAAVAYGYDKMDYGTYVVFDLGGGTFDVTILKMVEGVFQVLATSGDENLGGDDFDNAILEFLIQNYGLNIEGRIIEAILQIRALKERLSIEDVVSTEILDHHVSLSRTQYTDLITPLIQKTIAITEKALKDINLNKQDVTDIILVGGATRTPIIQKTLSATFGKHPVCTLDPDTVVAMGAAIQAHNLQTASSALLLDVVPLSLAIEIADGLVEKIIYRNTPLPFSKSIMFTTQKDGQTGFLIHVLQGEADKASGCRSIARFELKGIKPMPAGEARLEVSFNLDVDGLLSVKSTEEKSGLSKEIIVKPSYGLTEPEIEKLIVR